MVGAFAALHRRHPRAGSFRPLPPRSPATEHALVAAPCCPAEQALRRWKVRAGFLRERFQPRYWYWELVEMGRRLVLGSTLIFISPDTIAQPALGALLALAFLLLQTRVSPLASDALGAISLLSQTATLVRRRRQPLPPAAARRQPLPPASPRPTHATPALGPQRLARCYPQPASRRVTAAQPRRRRPRRHLPRAAGLARDGRGARAAPRAAAVLLAAALALRALLLASGVSDEAADDDDLDPDAQTRGGPGRARPWRGSTRASPVACKGAANSAAYSLAATDKPLSRVSRALRRSNTSAALLASSSSASSGAKPSPSRRMG